jgi:hypothetical protein
MDDGVAVSTLVIGRINKPKQIGNVEFPVGAFACFKANKLVAIVEHRGNFLQIWHIGQLNGQLSLLTSYGCIYWDQMKEFVAKFL